jgi:transposase InsO family protein
LGAIERALSVTPRLGPAAARAPTRPGEASAALWLPPLHALLRRQGERVNLKRVHRLYRDEGLHLRRSSQRRRLSGPRGFLVPCCRPNQRWSLDFMHDTLGSGRKFRPLNVLDDCTRECLCIEVSAGFSGAHVARVLERLCQGRVVPECIRSDNGPGFVSEAVQSMPSRYAGVETPLFFHPATRMLFGDAKKNVDAILDALRQKDPQPPSEYLAPAQWVPSQPYA